jgi:hypothetical protein
MSERAAEQLIETYHLTEAQALGMTALHELEGDISIRTVVEKRHPRLLGIEDQLAEYINPVVNVLHQSFDAEADAVVLIGSPRLIRAFLPKNTKTGTIKDMTVEMMAIDELPSNIPTIADQVTKSIRASRPRLESALFYRLLGTAQLGSTSSLIGASLGLIPFYDQDNDHFKYPLAAHQFPGNALQAIKDQRDRRLLTDKYGDKSIHSKLPIMTSIKFG